VKERLADSFDVPAIWKSVRFLVLLLVPIALVMGIAYFIISSNRAAEKARIADSRKSAEEKQRDAEQETKSKEEVAAKAKAAMSVGMMLAVLLGVAIYAFLLVTLGAWVAKDAYARGLNGLGWASFYYLFHFFSRVLIVGLSLIPALLIVGLGLFIIPVAEVVSWMSLVTYLYARRPGRLSPCKACGNRRLAYLVVCPHCGK
jgi:uncharacterized membrane protein